MKFLRIILLSFCAFCFIQMQANAVIESYGAGAIQQEIREQHFNDSIEKNIIEKKLQPKDKKEKKSLEEIQKETTEDDYYDPQFELKQIKFKGNKIYKDKDLQKIVEPLLNKEINIQEIINLAVVITKKYHYDGYITSYAYIPEQDVIDGVVTIQIVESKVEKINIENNKWTRRPYFTCGIFQPGGLKENKVFNIEQIDTAMAGLNKQDYVKGRFAVEKKDETTVVNLDVKDRFPIKLNVAWDDHGREYVGLQRARITLSNENVTGIGDRLYAGTVLARGTTGVLAGYQLPVSPWGTKLAFDYGYTHVKIGKDLSDYKISGNSSSYMIRLIQPIYKKTNTEIEFSTGLDFTNTNSNLGIQDLEMTNYSLRVLRNALYGTHDDKYGRTFLSINGDFGFRGLGAKSQGEGSPDTNFQKYAATIIRLQKIPVKKSYLVLRLNGQYSPDMLYPAEQMQLGGYSSVRGYETGALIADYGINGSIELRTPLWGLEQVLPQKYKKLSDNVKLVLFYDFGYVQEHNNAYNYTKNFLHSTGVGLNIFFNNGIALNLALGVPIGANDYKKGDMRFHFALSTDIDRLIYRKFDKEML